MQWAWVREDWRMLNELTFRRFKHNVMQRIRIRTLCMQRWALMRSLPNELAAIIVLNGVP
eukprot:2635372-Rhodomonas_salina.1